MSSAAGTRSVRASPGLGRSVDEALRSLEVLAVADILQTPLTAIATHVLPCAGPLERFEERTDLPVEFGEDGVRVLQRCSDAEPDVRREFALMDLGQELESEVLDTVRGDPRESAREEQDDERVRQ